MTNNLLTLIVLLALIGTFLAAPAPPPLSPFVASQGATGDVAVVAKSTVTPAD